MPEGSLEALAPSTRSLANVLRQAFETSPGLRLRTGVSVDGGPLPPPHTTYGYVSFAGGPPVLVPVLAGAIPYGDGRTYPGYVVYVLVFEGGMLAIGYVNTGGVLLEAELELADDERGDDADDT